MSKILKSWYKGVIKDCRGGSSPIKQNFVQNNFTKFLKICNFDYSKDDTCTFRLSKKTDIYLPAINLLKSAKKISLLTLLKFRRSSKENSKENRNKLKKIWVGVNLW